jgi:hypothetical protein
VEEAGHHQAKNVREQIRSGSVSSPDNGGDFMHDYEIRILNPDGSAAIITAEIHLTDASAIRSGRALADGLQFEVWRGMDCIYGARLPAAKVLGAPTGIGNAGYQH